MDPSDVVLRYLESIGRRADAEYYLALFRAERRESFAIIAVDAVTMRHAAAALALDLRFLTRLGLYPVITFGVVDGGDARGQAAQLVEWLAGEAPCRISAPADAAAAAREGVLPLVPLADDSPADIDARFARLGALAGALGTRKILFLNRRGGLKPHGGARLPLVDLTSEYDQLMAPGALSRSQVALLGQVKGLIDQAPHKLVVTVTSPLQLLRELFTVRGAGTLIRRGAAIDRHASYATVDRKRLDATIRSAFGRAPDEAFYARPVDRIFIAEGYRGAAICMQTPLGPYLGKFAVDRRAQGEGIGRDLWEAMNDDYPTLFWRSRAANPINSWYLQQCDGMVRRERWNVFWRDLADQRLPEAIAYALAQPVDFPRKD